MTPSTQETFNVYASGVFRFDIPDIGFSQELKAGDTNLNLNLLEFPLNAVCTERVVSETAERYCVTPTVAARWQQSVLDLAADEILPLPEGSCVFVFSGRISSSGLVVEARHFFGTTGEVVALEASRIIVASKVLDSF